MYIAREHGWTCLKRNNLDQVQVSVWTRVQLHIPNPNPVSIKIVNLWFEYLRAWPSTQT